MRKIQILGLAAIAVFAFTAIAASSALAKEWLWNGAAITAELASSIEGELLLEDMKASPAVIDVLCSGFFIGTIGPGAADLITLVESLTKEDNTLDCVAHEICESSLATVLVLNLPWPTKIVLVGEEILDVATGTGGEPGYEVECKTILGTFTDTCLAPTGGAQSLLLNEAADVFTEFSENETTTPPGNCTNGGAKQGLVVGVGLVTTPADGGTVSIS